MSLFLNVHLIYSSTGRYYCNYCLTCKQDDSPNGNAPLRTLEQMDEDLDKFKIAGSEKSNAKDVSHNVIAHRLVNIPLTQVSQQIV